MKPRKAKTKQRTHILYCSDLEHYRGHRELLKIAGERGWRVTPAYPSYLKDLLKIRSFQPDAVISYCDKEMTKYLISRLGEIPHVTLNYDSAFQLDLPGAAQDHMTAGRLVGEHYVKLGFRRFAVVGLASHPVLTQRVSGLLEVLRTRGLDEPSFLSVGKRILNEYSKHLNLLREFLASLPSPLAVVATNDEVAVKLMHACSLLEIAIPAQVAICGFDNDPNTCDLAPIPLSSVDTNPELQIREAARLLNRLIEGKAVPEKPVIIQPKGLIVRQSTGAPAVKNQTVAKAMSYIHQNVCSKDLSIPEIAEAINVDQSSLFAAFRRELSITPLTYITSLRVERAKRLLLESDQKINEIRPQCGFASDYQMYMAFKRTTGKSPRSFRQHA